MSLSSQRIEPTYVQKIGRLLTRKQRKTTLFLLGLMLIGTLLEMLGVGLVIPLVALLLQADLAQRYPLIAPLLQALGEPSQSALIIAAMLLLLGIYAIKALVLTLLIWQQGRFAATVQAHFAERLFGVYLHQPYTFHLQRNSAQLIRNINETQSFREGLAAMVSACTEALILLALGAVMLLIEPWLTLAVTALFGVAGGGYHYLIHRRLSAWGQVRQHHEGRRLQHLHQGLGGVKAIKLGGHEADFVGLYREHTIGSTQMEKRKFILQQLPRLGLELLAVASLSLLVVLMVLQGRGMADILPLMALFAAIAFRTMPSVNRLINALNAIRFYLPVTEKLYAELNLAASASDVAEAPGTEATADTFSTELVVDAISYTYPGASSPALQGVSLMIRPGQAVGILGTSGAGKSTLLDVLLGLLHPDAGSIKIDGAAMQTVRRAWQSQIGYVPQSIFLTDDSLRRNIAFGLPDASIDDEAVRQALRAARLDEFIATLPEGIETLVGEHGIRLSGGQRQRIGIARALYHDPAVLILDEATNALDRATEREVMRTVSALQGKKTTLIVAHRLAAIEHCDQLYRLEAGQVVQSGTPAQVLSQSPETDTATRRASA